MAHVGQELALGAARGFSCFLGLLHGFFRAFADGDILIDTERAGHLAIHDQGNTVKFDVYKTPVFSHALCHQGDRVPTESSTGDVPGFRKEIPLGEESVDGFANHLCPGILKQLFKRRIA